MLYASKPINCAYVHDTSLQDLTLTRDAAPTYPHAKHRWTDGVGYADKKEQWHCTGMKQVKPSKQASKQASRWDSVSFNPSLPGEHRLVLNFFMLLLAPALEVRGRERA